MKKQDPDREAEAFHAMLKAEDRKYRRWQIFHKCIDTLGVAMLLVAVFPAFFSHSHVNMGILRISCPLLMASGFLKWRTIVRQNKKLVSLSRDDSDRRNIPHLISALRYSAMPEYRAMLVYLSRVLLTVQAEDAPLITAESQQILVKEVARVWRRLHVLPDYYTEFVIASLGVLERTDAFCAIPYLDNLLEGRARQQGLDSVISLAVECLTYLKRRQVAMNQERSLLRPTSRIDMCGQELLLPATATKETSSEELLRPNCHELE